MEVVDRQYTKAPRVKRNPNAKSPGQTEALIRVRTGTRIYLEATDIVPTTKAEHERRALSKIQQTDVLVPPSDLRDENDKNVIEIPERGKYVRVKFQQGENQTEGWVPDNSEAREDDEIRYT